LTISCIRLLLLPLLPPLPPPPRSHGLFDVFPRRRFGAPVLIFPIQTFTNARGT
jgi:hypothetical protein